MPAVRIVRNPLAITQVTTASAYGLLALLFAVERKVKDVSVVMGGNRSRNTVKTKAGTPRVGGTLRRSWHAVVKLNGETIPGSHTVDEKVEGDHSVNGGIASGPEAVPDYPSTETLEGWVGSNSNYGAWVDQGTLKMGARPMLQPAVNSVLPIADELIAAGIAKHGGGAL